MEVEEDIIQITTSTIDTKHSVPIEAIPNHPREKRRMLPLLRYYDATMPCLFAFDSNGGEDRHEQATSSPPIATATRNYDDKPR